MRGMTPPDASKQQDSQIAPLPPTPAAPSPAAAAPRRRGPLGTLLAIIVALVSALYLVNPTLGVFEFLPDNLPLIGNLDEAFFTLALATSLGALGLRLPFQVRR